ncbi:hypothetical protein G6O46_25080, partial [Salmonella enterica subsp. enterica serovar Enteritidis]
RQCRELRVSEGERHGIGEEAAIEEWDSATSRHVARAHQTEESAEPIFDVASARALVEERREVLLGQEADVLGKHRKDALERELHDLSLSLRMLLFEASIEPRDELGDLTRDLR